MCIGDTGVSKIGLLTADEVMLAGASINENKDYYLRHEKDNLSSK